MTPLPRRPETGLYSSSQPASALVCARRRSAFGERLGRGHHGARRLELMTTTIEVTEVDGFSTSVAGPAIEYVRTDAGDVPNRVTSVKTSDLTVCIGQMGIFADRQYGCPGWNRGTRVAREGCGRRIRCGTRLAAGTLRLLARCHVCRDGAGGPGGHAARRVRRVRRVRRFPRSRRRAAVHRRTCPAPTWWRASRRRSCWRARPGSWPVPMRDRVRQRVREQCPAGIRPAGW